jgi:hypothetical protein
MKIHSLNIELTKEQQIQLIMLSIRKFAKLALEIDAKIDAHEYTDFALSYRNSLKSNYVKHAYILGETLKHYRFLWQYEPNTKIDLHSIRDYLSIHYCIESWESFNKNTFYVTDSIFGLTAD